jgi:hypothetical protein
LTAFQIADTPLDFPRVARERSGDHMVVMN